MKAWRALVVLSFLLLSGCLVTFKEPIPANEAAPVPLLGVWSRTDEWGELRYLDITRSGSNLYKADTYVETPTTCPACRATASPLPTMGGAGTCRPGCPSGWARTSPLAVSS